MSYRKNAVKPFMASLYRSLLAILIDTNNVIAPLYHLLTM